jgi:isopentenyldiphosphate isomerase
MTLLKLVKEMNNVSRSIPFLCNDIIVGHVSPSMIPYISEPLKVVENTIVFDTLKSAQENTRDLEALIKTWDFECLKGWRNERYAVYGPNGVLFEVERAACGLLGVRTYGCHLNGYTIINGELKMWIGKRSLTKSKYPGMWDQMVAGGLTGGLKPRDCMVKECGEEAGMNGILAKNAKAVGVVTFWQEKGIEIQPSTNYIFDLDVEDFIPKPVDGEVDEFQLLSLDVVMKMVLAEEFKPEAMLVVVDFLMRHGMIEPDMEGYDQIQMLLKTALPFPGPVY